MCASGLQVGSREAGVCRFSRRQSKIRRREASLHRPMISSSEPLLPVAVSRARSVRQIKQSAKHKPKSPGKKLPQCMQNRHPEFECGLSSCQIVPQAYPPNPHPLQKKRSHKVKIIIIIKNLFTKIKCFYLFVSFRTEKPSLN